MNPSLNLSKKKCKIHIIKLSQFSEQLKVLLANAEINDFAKEFIYKNLLENNHDFPITLPLEDGFSIDGSNNKLNPWVEILGNTYFLKEMAQSKFSDAEENGVLIHTCFMGIDNAFYYAIVFNVMRYVLGLQDYPKNYYINRYYLLEGKKFSTSRGHVIWADDVLKQFSLESLRFFLASTYPLNENYDFNKQKLEEFDKFDVGQSCNKLLGNSNTNMSQFVRSLDENIPFYEYAAILLATIRNENNNSLDLLYLVQILLPKTSEKMFRNFGKIEQITELSTCSSKVEFGIKLNRLIYLTENNFCASVAEVALNQQTIPHKHDDLEEIFFITSGEGVLSIDDNTYCVKPNDYIYIPGGKLHTIKQNGKTPLIFITIAWKKNKSNDCTDIR